MTQYIRLTNSTENQTTTNYCKEWFGEKCSDNKDGRGGNKGNYCHWNNYINCGPLEGCFCDCENEFETIKSDLKEYNSTVVSDVTLSQLNEQFIWGHTKVEYNKKCLIPTGTTMVPNFNNVTTSIIESGTKPLYVKTCPKYQTHQNHIVITYLIVESQKRLKKPTNIIYMKLKTQKVR